VRPQAEQALEVRPMVGRPVAPRRVRRGQVGVRTKPRRQLPVGLDPAMDPAGCVHRTWFAAWGAASQLWGLEVPKPA